MRSMNDPKAYTHIDTDDSVLSLHDCCADRIQFEDGILSFYFPDGFWIPPLHPANTSSEIVRTDAARVDYHIEGAHDVSIEVFRKNIFKQTICTQWTLEELIRRVNHKSFRLEFIYQYKNHTDLLWICWLHFDKKPYHYECRIYICAPSKTEYLWNNLCSDRTW